MDEWKTVEQQIDELTDRPEQIVTNDAGCCHIRQIAGIGPMVATAIVAAIGNGGVGSAWCTTVKAKLRLILVGGIFYQSESGDAALRLREYRHRLELSI